MSPRLRRPRRSTQRDVRPATKRGSCYEPSVVSLLSVPDAML